LLRREEGPLGAFLAYGPGKCRVHTVLNIACEASWLANLVSAQRFRKFTWYLRRVEGVPYACTIKTTSGVLSASPAEIRALLAFPKGIYKEASLALHAPSHCAVRHGPQSGCVTVHACLITHVSDVVAAQCFRNRVDRILSEVLGLITLDAAACGLIAI